MIRLAQQSNKNSPTEYDRIFVERQKKGVDEHDMRRWEKLLKFYKGGDLIDIGCLDSQIIPMADKICPGSIQCGIDLAEECIEQMRDKYPWGIFAVKDICKNDIAPEIFDYAVMGEVLEHLEDPEKAIAEAMRILKPGGTLAISVPLEEVKEPGACDGERHLWSFSEADIYGMCASAIGIGKAMPWDYEVVGSLLTWKPPFYRYHWKSLITFCTKS